MNLKGKMVWDLSLYEIEYVYRNLHMNNYVYAALKTYHTSSPPLNRPVSLRANTIPAYLRVPIDRLLRFSPYIGKYDPSFVRAGITYCTYQLYSVLNQVQLENVSLVAQLLAACAYLAIYSDKNDNVSLWKKKVVRSNTEYTIAVMEKLLEPVVDVEEICMMPWLYKYKNVSEGGHGDLVNIFKFVPRAITTIIILIENGYDPQLIERALLNVEQAMRTYEHKYEFIDHNSPVRIRDPEQFRYRNTLYLYGGMFFEKQGWHDRAVDWYLKDINFPELPTVFNNNYLVDIKAIERLISAYSLTTNKEMQSNLKDLINHCFVQAAHDAAKYNRMVLKYFKSHPSSDMRFLFIHPDNRRTVYGGEASREVYFISLLYNKFILGTDYQDIDYARFFDY